MGTFEIEEGDSICIFLGGNVPYILRSVEDGNDYWTFVGHAYVHRIIDVRLNILLLLDEEKLLLTVGNIGRIYPRTSARE